jgi:hypothetical protein
MSDALFFMTMFLNNLKLQGVFKKDRAWMFGTLCAIWAENYIILIKIVLSNRLSGDMMQ